MSFVDKPERFEYRGKGSFDAWMSVVVHRLLAQRFRGLHSQKRGEGNPGDALTSENAAFAVDLPTRSATPTPTSVSRFQEMIEWASMHLTPDEFTVWDLIDIRKYTSVEVARALERTDASVRGTLHRACKKLRAKFGSH